MVMTSDVVILSTALKTCGMLEIDGLHAFDFEFDEAGLRIECMDGREKKRWSFTAQQVVDATFDNTLQSWTLTGDSGEHRLVCMSAFSAKDEEDEEDDGPDA